MGSGVTAADARVRVRVGAERAWTGAMKRLTATALIVTASLVLGAGCEDDGERTEPRTVTPVPLPQPESRTRPETDGEAAKREFSTARRAFVDSARHRMAQLDAKIAELRAREATESEQAKGRLEEAIDDLKDERADVEERLHRAEAQSETGWNEFEKDASRAIDDLERSYNELLERMKTS
jgi:hypothetical protein